MPRRLHRCVAQARAGDPERRARAARADGEPRAARAEGGAHAALADVHANARHDAEGAAEAPVDAPIAAGRVDRRDRSAAGRTPRERQAGEPRLRRSCAGAAASCGTACEPSARVPVRQATAAGNHPPAAAPRTGRRAFATACYAGGLVNATRRASNRDRRCCSDCAPTGFA
jgi:hypothetical protein